MTYLKKKGMLDTIYTFLCEDVCTTFLLHKIKKVVY